MKGSREEKKLTTKERKRFRTLINYMKRWLISFTFFLGLLRSHALFAQNNNQVIGCRLEMPLQRQEMEDSRWKMEVEAQGCSFQEIEGSVINGIEYKDVDNQSSFLANNSVPISNLPSSISYLGITPKLMINPALEEGAKALEKELGIFTPLQAHKAVQEGESKVKVFGI